ncbi:UDP-glucuronic acid decarboxylase family protein [Candidatus Solincola sp.]|nr:SDR family oxidoreductase [Actinomycetota bacterium]MDI7252591.1 SDR family oxidoreductase [Actinomycetota bacterium]
MKVLVTGGAGFIGSHLCERLVEEGHAVWCLDNLCTGSMENLEGLKGHPRFRFILADVADPLTLEVDAVAHLASPASPVDYHRMPVETMLANSMGTYQALEVARKNGARFLLASTSEVYGDPLKVPQDEEYTGNVNPVGPRACYDESKRFAEALTSTYRRLYGTETVILRIFNTYGPRMRREDGRVVPNFIQQALAGEPLTVYGDGSQTRSFCYVDDLVEGICLALRSERAVGEVINLGNDREMTVLELAHRIREMLGSTSEITFLPLPQGDPRRRKPDLTRARELLGWEPATGLEEGLRRTVEWFRR